MVEIPNGLGQKAPFLSAFVRELPGAVKTAHQIGTMAGETPYFNMIFSNAAIDVAVKSATTKEGVLPATLLASKTLMALDEAIEHGKPLSETSQWWGENRVMRKVIEEVSRSMWDEVRIEREFKEGRVIDLKRYIKTTTSSNGVQLLGSAFAQAVGEEEYLNTPEFKRKAEYINFNLRLMADYMKYPKDKKKDKPNVLIIAENRYSLKDPKELLKAIQSDTEFSHKDPFIDEELKATDRFLLKFFEVSKTIIDKMTPLWHAAYHSKK